LKDIEDYITALKQKDEVAFSEIYYQTEHAVFALIFSILKDQMLSEDVMQEVYIKMISRINQYQSGTNFRNWLLTIARNAALDCYNQRKNEYPLDPIENEDLFPQTEGGAFVKLQTEELLGLLDIDEREVVILRIVDDLKFKDIAAIIDRPLGTVLWLYNKAIKKMQKHLRGEN